MAVKLRAVEFKGDDGYILDLSRPQTKEIELDNVQIGDFDFGLMIVATYVKNKIDDRGNITGSYEEKWYYPYNNIVGFKLLKE